MTNTPIHFPCQAKVVSMNPSGLQKQIVIPTDPE
jgi:hypothetical protein